MPTRALDGVRVVDLSRFISGPYCALLLADLGADVLKVESGSGDPSRLEGPWLGDESLYYAQMNRNKRGMWLDLRSDEGRQELGRILKDTDVLIENFRPGVLDAMGFGQEALGRLNPRCITVSVSGFGQVSANRDRGAFDAIVQSLSGLAAVTGGPSDFPLLMGTYITDMTAALLAAIGTLAALRQRDDTGHGQLVDVSLLDAALVQLGALVPAAELTDYEPERVGNHDRTSAPANAYRANDGWVYIHAGSDAFWARLLKLMNREDLLGDPRFRDERVRIENREAADAIVADWVAPRSVGEVERILESAGLLVSHINSVVDAVHDATLGIPDRLVESTGSNGKPVRTLGMPIRLSDSPMALRHDVPGGART